MFIVVSSEGGIGATLCPLSVQLLRSAHRHMSALRSLAQSIEAVVAIPYPLFGGPVGLTGNDL